MYALCLSVNTHSHYVRKSIHVLVNTSTGFGRQVIRGVARYARSFTDWELNMPPLGFGVPDLTTQLQEADGVVARIVERGMARRLERLPCPVINVSDAIPGLPFPLVTHDPRATAALAVSHGLDRGFRRFAYCGFDEHGYSRARGDALAQICHEQGLPCARYQDIRARRRSLSGERRRLSRWVRSLDESVLVVCCNDIRAQQVVDACRADGLAIPDWVAVIGIDDDEVVCTACPVEVSSIDVGAEGIGFRAAERLAAILSGTADSGDDERIPPGGVVPRASTDILVVDDPTVRAALRVIRVATPPSTVQEVLDQVPVSRRALEQAFRVCLGRSPLQEINAVRLSRARELLGSTDLPVYAVATRAGYPNANHFATAFRTSEGLSPSTWRRRHGRS